MRLAWFEWFLTALGVGLLGLFVEHGQAMDALAGLLLIAYGSSRLEPQAALGRVLSSARSLASAWLRPVSLVRRPARLVRRLYARLSSQG
jgi:hypothetical protein